MRDIDCAQHPPIYLIQARGAVERQLLEDWVQEQRRDTSDAPIEHLYLVAPRKETAIAPQSLQMRLQRGDDPLLAPIRITWLPKQRQGKRSIRLRDLILIGDPRNPRGYAKWWLARFQPERLQVLEGETATAVTLRETWRNQSSGDRDSEDGSFAHFVARRALLALERAQSHLLGPQYKMPRLVRDEIRNSARYHDGLAGLVRQQGLDPAEAEKRAETALQELASGYTPLGIDINMYIGRFFYQRGYDPELDYDPEQADKVRSALTGTPGVVLPSHRSNLDAGVMPNAFHKLELPRTNTLGGINMAFWPLGYIMRRSGVIFIRRDIKSDPVYRWMLKEYIGYLVEKGFNLEWYIEGTRSRTGKSLPPKLGLLKYVADAYREGRCSDIALIPSSITYDQLREAGEYAREARGELKKAESIGWFYRYYRSLKGNYGKIYVRFGDPVSLRAELGSAEEARALSAEAYFLALQKLAFAVSHRINRVAPVTAVSLITLTLLGTFERALTLAELGCALAELREFMRRQQLPTTHSCGQLTDPDMLDRILRDLARLDLLHIEDRGTEAVYAIAHQQHLTAAFYRNSILHHFLDAAICELSLAAARQGSGAAVEQFWETAIRQRDLLKFDFIFPGKEEFRQNLQAFMDDMAPDWEELLGEDRNSVDILLQGFQPLTANMVLRAFYETYWVVAHCLELRPQLAAEGETAFFRFCSGTGRQLFLQGVIHSHDTGSPQALKSALELARHRSEGASEHTSYDQQLQIELQELLTQIDHLNHIGRERFHARIVAPEHTDDQ